MPFEEADEVAVVFFYKSKMGRPETPTDLQQETFQVQQ